LEALAAKHGFTFVNLHPAFVDANGALRTELTNDHLHLMADGYVIWVSLIKPYIDELVRSKISPD
jgi:lysophospholipase L1-like esterase